MAELTTFTPHLSLAWERLRWEAFSNPFLIPDCFFHLNVRRFEVLSAGTGQELVGHLQAAVQTDRYRPGPGQDLTLVRGARIRPQRSLELADYLLVLACLTRCHSGLLEGLGPPQPRAFQLSRDPAAIPWLEPPTEAAERDLLHGHRWWLVADVANCSESMDYRRLLVSLARLGLERPWLRSLGRLLATQAAGPRQGVVSCGRANHALTRLYLNPVLEGLRREGYTWRFSGLDDFHIFVESRRDGLRALERLRVLLASVGLQVNFAKSWLVESRRALREQSLSRFRWDYLRHRLASWGARWGWPVATWLESSLENALFVHRRPAFASLLAYPVTQEAFWRRLQHDDLFFGDRALILLYLAWCPERPRGKLRAYLESQDGPLYRAAREGLELSQAGVCSRNV